MERLRETGTGLVSLSSYVSYHATPFIHRGTTPCHIPPHTVRPTKTQTPYFIDNKQDKQKKTMKRAIITVVGKDNVGIIARICTHLADNSINILDISQTIVNGYFNMMMIVDLSSCPTPFDEISSSLATTGSELGVIAKCQLEDIFDKMHRI